MVIGDSVWDLNHQLRIRFNWDDRLRQIYSALRAISPRTPTSSPKNTSDSKNTEILMFVKSRFNSSN
jgi:hypothetical protein